MFGKINIVHSFHYGNSIHKLMLKPTKLSPLAVSNFFIIFKVNDLEYLIFRAEICFFSDDYLIGYCTSLFWLLKNSPSKYQWNVHFLQVLSSNSYSKGASNFII